jgi:hypothetical protein
MLVAERRRSSRTAWAVAGLALLFLAGASLAVVHSAPSPALAGASSGPISGGSNSAPSTLASEAPPSPAATITLSDPGLTPAAISLSWTATTGLFFSEYEVQESNVSATGPFTTVGVVTTQTTSSYAVDGLAPGASYWWRVISVVTLGTDSTSNVLEAAQPNLAYLTDPTVTSTTATLNWTNNATYGGLLGFNSYAILESSEGGPYGVAGTVTEVGTLSDTVTGLSGGSSYSFYVNTSDCLDCASGPTPASTTPSNIVTIGTVLTLSASVASSRSVLDVGQTTLLTCTPSGGESPFHYAWSTNGSAPVSGNATWSRAFPGSGTYALGCQVTDHLGTEADGGVTLEVNADPTASVAANRTTADVDEPISTTCAGSGGTPTLSLETIFGDGSSAIGASWTHTYTAAGTYVLTCAVTDGAGFEVTDSVDIVVSPSLVVRATVSTTVAAPGTVVQFNGTALNGSGTYTAYAWEFGDGSSGSGTQAQHAYSAAGTYSASVRVTDSNGLSASFAVSITVSPVAVQAVAIPTHGTAGDGVEFSVAGSGGAGGPYNYTWTFGDGSVGYGATVDHVYAGAGSYVPTVVVRDHLGATTSATYAGVSVAAPPPPLNWLPLWVLLAVAAVAGLVLGTVVYRRSRSASADDLTGMSRWVPPVGPKGAVEGLKKCSKCGATNPSTRHSCQVCGAPLRRA